jgi:hypothetical protein
VQAILNYSNEIKNKIALTENEFSLYAIIDILAFLLAIKE